MSVHLIMQFLFVAGELKTEVELIQRLEALLEVYDFGFYRLSLQPTLQKPSHDLTLAVRWPKGWAEIYRFKKYASVDPAMRLLPIAQRPYRLREAAFALRNEAHRSRMQRLVQDAARYGMRDGYVFPVHGRTGLLGSLLVSGKPVDLTPTEVALFETVARNMFWRALELRGWAAELEKFGPLEVSLTKREMEVVTHLAEGLTSHEIARALQISNHTVDWYINGLQDKMRAKNRQHVVALAFRRGLVS